MLLIRRFYISFMLVFGLALSSGSVAQAASSTSDQSLKLYVLDGGVLEAGPASYNLLEEEVETTLLSLASFLIVHPDGVLLWDAGSVMEGERAGGAGTRQLITRSDMRERPVTLGAPMLELLAEIGYSPEDVTHLALSHYHWDHSANANLFAHAKWFVRPEEREAMFSPLPPGGNSSRPETFADLRNSETILVRDEEFDVFGDGLVVLKAARGHTPGHQVLYVNLANTGGVVLAGDLYHYGEERTLNRLPVADFNVQQTRVARVKLEEFLLRKDATLWIQHDLPAHRLLRKSPEFYD
ncbi:N-acyl homoserine lactonase family protein [Gammaproteobacteria bacterium AH-315-E17]|nr:N-acyl homoserine lactonase family protein [Gammaproteobacteria bacterium AH-315-E17]